MGVFKNKDVILTKVYNHWIDTLEQYYNSSCMNDDDNFVLDDYFFKNNESSSSDNISYTFTCPNTKKVHISTNTDNDNYDNNKNNYNNEILILNLKRNLISQILHDKKDDL